MNLRLQHWPQADAAFSRAIELYGSDKRAARPLMQRSQLRQRSQPDASLADMERAISVDPDYADARYVHAAALWQRGQNKAALAESDRSIALDPAPGLYHQMRGLILEATGDLSGARSELDIGVQREAKMFMTWSSRAALELKLADFPAARDDARQARTLFSDAPGSLVTMAIAEVFLGDVRAAAADLREAAAKHPAELAAHAPIADASPDDILRRLSRDPAHAARAELAWGVLCQARAEIAEANGHYDAALARDASLEGEIQRARAALQ
jgi:tetratricopeptide (TPR) repeat protein